MNIRTLPLAFFFLLLIVAGLAGYFTQKPADSDETVKKDDTKTESTPLRKSLPDNRPLNRSKSRDHDVVLIDDTPPFALQNERIVQFADEASYKRFLSNLQKRGLRLLGRSDRLRAARVGFRSLTDLEGIDGAELGFNFQVGLPTPPPGGVQEGALGFGPIDTFKIS